MERHDALFLEAVAAALKNEQVPWNDPIPDDTWSALLRLAEAHRMLPMVFQAIYRCPAAAAADPEILRFYRGCSLQMVVLQTRKTAEFRPILKALAESGAAPLVVKGITCRELYPNPDHRLSSDEDVLIDPAYFDRSHEALTRLGFSAQDHTDSSYEVSYLRPEGALYIEIHRSLFPPESDAYGDMNRFFRDVRGRAVTKQGIPTLHPTDHLLYLICHAFKHFLHSGFGLRQVCDLILFANAYGPEIDWAYVLDCCRQIRAENFAAGLFRIGWKYLGFSLEDSRYPLAWQAIYVDELPLLEDVLRAGVYGSADRDRVHSSRITLGAVASQKQGKAGSGSLLQSIFPSRQAMEGKYPYLREKPMLLPIAWTDRIMKYSKSSANADQTIRTGNQRVALLKRYGVLDE